MNKNEIQIGFPQKESKMNNVASIVHLMFMVLSYFTWYYGKHMRHESCTIHVSKLVVVVSIITGLLGVAAQFRRKEMIASIMLMLQIFLYVVLIDFLFFVRCG